ncbi:MAG: hypothetical protein F4201_09510 [Nitrospira sp. SB0677_bin_15]|nr:hypothetical protein [Nitrospira sp. SB0667_bin_9]MYD31187.1 hypothetical protein [Nitrospira sp. SB0661_bin_20]MYG41028.1 hypothetical protein [Nitrospira sp. SB0677_bin_15]MYJ22092.1 hypothetical protein [Nitrospira sp. SB0673_bin_12]
MTKRLRKWTEVFSRSQTRVGLDIGSSTVKLVQLEQRAGRYRLKRFSVRRLGSTFVEEGASRQYSGLKTALSNLLQGCGLLGSPVAISVSGPSVMVKRIRVSGVQTDALDEYLTWEGHQYIPYAMNDIYFDYWILPQPRSVSKELELLLVAAKQQVVESRKTLLEEIGVHPVVCDVDGLALMKTIMQTRRAFRGKSFAVANVGAGGMNLIFVHDEQPLVIRDVTFEETSSSLTDGDAVVVEGPIRHSSSLAGTGYPENPSAMAEIVRETKCCFESVLERYPELDVEKLFLCGGQSHDPRLRTELHDALGIPALPFNPFEEIECSPDCQDRLWASAHLGGVAVGLALHQDNHG